jgi:hypothetical protein
MSSATEQRKKSEMDLERAMVSTIKTSSSKDEEFEELLIWELPEVLVYHIVSYVAPATDRASVLCHKIAPLCKASSKAILEESSSEALWDLVLAGDYGVDNPIEKDKRRHCKRLRRCPINRVRDAHKLLQSNTEIAYFFLWELSYEKNTKPLTKSQLLKILDEYGPRLRFNKTVSSGGTFLVEVCRARHTSQTMILQCVQELVEHRMASVNLASNESSNCILTALAIASSRGMPNVVKYLLSKGASPSQRCSARFRLYKNPKKSVRCTTSTPLEFSMEMQNVLKEQRSENCRV